MNRSQVFMLLAVVGLATFYAWSKLHKLQTSEREFQVSRYFPKLEGKDVSKIKVVSADPKFVYTLQRIGDQWYIDGHLLNIEKSYQLISSILELTREREMDPAPTQERLTEFKLDKPGYQVTVWDNQNQDLGTVNLGQRTPDFNHFYGQWASGGAVSTVPAYTLGVLEEEPKDLRELSFFPVEVAAVERFTIEKAQLPLLSLQRDKDETFSFTIPDISENADETQVKKYLSQLRELKVARFLADEEKAADGAPEMVFRANVTYHDHDVVTELHQRVAVKPKFVYGKRYLHDAASNKPVTGTEERFVVELPVQSEVAQPNVEYFQDRRILLFDLDKVSALSVEAGERNLALSKDGLGKWNSTSDLNLAPESVSGLLWTLKDLRYTEVLEGVEPTDETSLFLQVEQNDGRVLKVRFVESESGNSYIWRDSKGYALSDSSWKALSDSVSKLFPTQKDASVEH